MKIGFVGTGKISSAVVKAICSSKLKDFRIFVSPRNEMTSKSLAEKHNEVTRCGSNQEVIEHADILFIALKTDVYESVIERLTFRKEQTIVSLIPFSTYEHLKKLVYPVVHICRATPLPTVVNHICPIPVYKPNDAVLNLLSSIGQVFEVETEEQFHTIWTITSLISPYYDLMAGISDWAMRNSVEKSMADKYVADMFSSLALAASKSVSPDFGALSVHAATPGGLNEWTAKSIRDSGAHTAYIKAAEYILHRFEKK